VNEREGEKEREKRKLHEPDVRERKSVSECLLSISKDISIALRFVARFDELRNSMIGINRLNTLKMHLKYGMSNTQNRTT